MSYKKMGILIVSALFVSIPLSTVTTAQEITTNNNISFQRDLTTNSVKMLRAKSDGIPLQTKNNETIADSVKRQFAPYFGISDPTNKLIVKRDFNSSVNRRSIRYQQQHKGIPVIGGELIANLNNQQLSSMSGETSKISLTNLVPKISAEQAQATAITAVSKWQQLNPTSLTASKPTLKIYDPKLIGPGSGQQHLVWELNVTPTELMPINEYVLVDAGRNVIVLHFNKIHTALNRETYTANNLQVLPGTLVCNESDPTCAAGDVDAQSAHGYAADAYNYYFNTHNRNSIDGNGMTIITTTQYGTAPNAFWNGSQMAFGPGFSLADDVVAHEFTHGVTTNTSNLFYYYQSGAINESFSDVWGEFVDLTNTGGTDTPAVRWQLGEDVPGVGAIRNMMDPTLFGQPDRMTNANYVTSATDRGGVHANSGINNKAVFLMVDGGSFNGQTVTGIGINKTAAIYYDVQINYLLTGSDYLDLYNVLNQSCQSLIGTNGIISNDCTQVNNALLAVEMNQEPIANFNPEATICAGSASANNIFFDDMESSSGNWGTLTLIGANPWSYATGFAKTGSRSYATRPDGTSGDSSLVMINPVTLPSQGNVYLHFDHAFDYEFAGTTYYDGGIIEYSTNGGTNWLDAGPLIDSGRAYTGALAGSNPLVGRNAFVATSHGYNSSRVNLSSLIGNNVQIRFRNTADSSVASFIWTIDNVRIYTCGTPPVANAGPDQNVNANTNVTLDGSGSSDADSSFTYQWVQTTGTAVTLSGTATANPTFTAPAASAQLTFQLTTSDPSGFTDTDTVTINVNGPPTANAGGNQTVNLSASVTLDGSGSSDPEAGPLTYSWMQTAGITVTLSSSSATSPTFTTPASASTLTFQLTVTDNQSQTGRNTVTITVQAPGTSGGGGGCTVSKNGRFDPIWLSLLLLLSLVHLRWRVKIR